MDFSLKLLSVVTEKDNYFSFSPPEISNFNKCPVLTQVSDAHGISTEETETLTQQLMLVAETVHGPGADLFGCIETSSYHLQPNNSVQA